MTPTNTIPAGRVGGIYIEPHELEIVQRILRGCIPDREVQVFGSRATGTRLKRFSDLDLAIAGRLTAAESARLAYDFDESALPFKVDLVELGDVEEGFARRIQPDFISVQAPSRL